MLTCVTDSRKRIYLVEARIFTDHAPQLVCQVDTAGFGGTRWVFCRDCECMSYETRSKNGD